MKPDTGKLVWYFQMVPGDEWDFDSVQHLMLADVTIKGQPRKVIMQANKNGFYYVIDRVSGKFISGQPFAQVTWASGLNEETGRPIINPESYYGTRNQFRSLRAWRRAQLVSHVVQSRDRSGVPAGDRQRQLRLTPPIRISNIRKNSRTWASGSGMAEGRVRRDAANRPAQPRVSSQASASSAGASDRFRRKAPRRALCSPGIQ